MGSLGEALCVRRLLGLPLPQPPSADSRTSSSPLPSGLQTTTPSCTSGLGARGLASAVVSALNSNEMAFKVIFATPSWSQACDKQDKDMDECIIPLTLPRTSPPTLVPVWCVLFLSLILRYILGLILRAIEATTLISKKQLRSITEIITALESSISLACYAQELR